MYDQSLINNWRSIADLNNQIILPALSMKFPSDTKSGSKRFINCQSFPRNFPFTPNHQIARRDRRNRLIRYDSCSNFRQIKTEDRVSDSPQNKRGNPRPNRIKPTNSDRRHKTSKTSLHLTRPSCTNCAEECPSQVT